MIPQPLHPAVVHFPIVLVVLLPIVAVAASILIRRGVEPRGAWLPVVAVAFALAGSAWIAVQTGEREEDAVEEVVAESAIHVHEEAAEVFMPLTFVALLLVGGGLMRGRPGQAARPLATLATVLLLGLGYRVGHTGGELVYEHGAASAYASNRGQSMRDADDRGRSLHEESEHESEHRSEHESET